MLYGDDVDGKRAVMIMMRTMWTRLMAKMMRTTSPVVVMIMTMIMIMMVRLLNSKLITQHRGMTRGLSECRICTEYDTRIEYDGWVYILTQVCQRNTCDSRILHGDPCMTRE